MIFLYSVCSHLYASEANCEESNVEHKSELERPQFNDLVAKCKEILTSMGKILESMAAKIVIDPEPLVFVETKVVEEPEPELKFVEDPKSETKIVAGLVSLQEEISS